MTTENEKEVNEVALKKPQLDYITYFRGIAIFCIVTGHGLWGAHDMLETLQYIFAGGTFYFIFIAGFLFQYLSYKYNYIVYLKKKFENIILPYIITLSPFALLFALTSTDIQNPLYQFPKWIKFISIFFMGYLIDHPMWFMGMITIFFIMSPLFILLNKNKKVFTILTIIGIITIIFIPRPTPVPYVYKDTDTIFNVYIPFLKHYVQNFLFFSPVWMLGMLMCQFNEKYPDFIFKYKKLILYVLSTLVVIFYLFFVFFSHYLITSWTIARIFEMLFIFSLLYLFENKITQNKFWQKTLKTLSDYSFGLFFIHVWFMNIMLYHSVLHEHKEAIFNIERNTLSCFLYSTLMLIITYAGSIMILWAIKCILKKLGVKNTRKFIGV